MTSEHDRASAGERLSGAGRPVALVTGAGRTAGIGAGVATQLAASGWDIAFTYWTAYDRRMRWGIEAGATSAIEGSLTRHGAAVAAIEADLADTGSPGLIFDETERRLGSVTALVMCHCESVDSGLLDTTVESFDRHFAVNARATWLLIREFGRRFRGARGTGRIISRTSDHTVGNWKVCSRPGGSPRGGVVGHEPTGSAAVDGFPVAAVACGADHEFMGEGQQVALFCVVANVAEETAHGEGGLELRRGVKHFAAGAKVWVLPPQWGDGGAQVIVAGYHRGTRGRGLARMVVPRRYLTGFRVQAVYSPAVARELTRPLTELGREHAPAMWPAREDALQAAANWRDRPLEARAEDGRWSFSIMVSDPPPQELSQDGRTYYLAHFNANRAIYSAEAPPAELAATR